jgi:hypothetical protein
VIIEQIEQLDRERKTRLNDLKLMLAEDDETLSIAAEPTVKYKKKAK